MGTVRKRVGYYTLARLISRITYATNLSMKDIKAHKKEGTFRAARHAGKVEVNALASTPKPPSNLTKKGAGYWKIYCQHLLSFNSLQEKDLFAIADLCNQRVIADEAQAEVDKHGVMMAMPGREGTVYRRNPATTILQETIKTINSLEKQFGLTLLSGQRLNASDADTGNADDDLFD